MSFERVDVEYVSGGETIRAWFVPPRGDRSEPVPAVVFCPGFTGTKYAAFYEPYIEGIIELGCAVLAIDYRGWGDSDGERGLIRPWAQVEDIRNGLAYLRGRPDIDAGHCGLLGMSFGGGNVVQAAALETRLSCCVAVSPVGDGEAWLRGMRREYEWYELLDALDEDRARRAAGGEAAWVDPTEEILVATPERRRTTVKGSVPAGKVPRSTPLWCVDEIRSYRPHLTAGDITPAGLLLFAVRQDSIVPPLHSRLIHERAAEPKRLVQLPGREHYGAYLGQFTTIWGEIRPWLCRHLGLAQADPAATG